MSKVVSVTPDQIISHHERLFQINVLVQSGKMVLMVWQYREDHNAK